MSDHAKYLILSTLVIAWCFLHSAMISISVTEYLKRSLGSPFRYYRLFYNVVAAITLVPVVLFAYSVRTQPVFSWDGYLRIIQFVMLGTSGLLFFLGGRHYDARQLLGIKQLQEGTSNKAITDSGALDTSGVLGVIRHPWYSASILLIWAGQLDVSAILVNTILTAYLFIGTVLEEKKLLREFGAEYRDYQARVSMFIPYKWLTSIISKRVAG
ncbi:MAG: isoprenylcysteine carboxylmethyltransferase family protein [Nitrospirae bacterium]|nr:isoprenylcysteine carboxylmethyltransferase family protein [Nitrospirota bacterium]